MSVRDDLRAVNAALVESAHWHEMQPDVFRSMYGHHDRAALIRRIDLGFFALRRVESTVDRVRDALSEDAEGDRGDVTG